MASTTTNYGFTLPGVADPIDQDLWGTELNSNLTLLDTILGALTADTQGAVVIVNSGNNGFTTITSQGTLGQALVSQGANTPPVWGNVSGSAILLSTKTASNSPSITFDDILITTAYSKYTIEFISVIPGSPGSGTPDFRVKMSTDNGTTFPTVEWIVENINVTGSGYASNNGTGQYIELGSSGVYGAGAQISGDIVLYDPSNANIWKMVGGTQVYVAGNSGNRYGGDIIASIDNTTPQAINFISFAFGAGNIASGTFKLYGTL